MKAGEDPRILPRLFEVICQDRIIKIVLAAAEPKSFEFLGRIIQEIDKYGGTAKIDKTEK